MLDLQSSQGGPIIAVQVENEYGSFSFDPVHLVWLRDLLWKSRITELLVTSDNETCARGVRALSEGTGEGQGQVGLFNIPGVLPTANGMTVGEVSAVFAEIRRERGSGESDAQGEAGEQRESEKSRPLMVMELWSGWFDYWGAPNHETTTATSLLDTVRYAFSQGSSINLYMFHGGTNFGFMNGALQLPPDTGFDSDTTGAKREESSAESAAVDLDSYPFKPDVTSYDYDAPLSEDGCITGKYLALRSIIAEERRRISKSLSADLPDVPKENRRAQIPLLVGGWAGESDECTPGMLERLAWDDLVSCVTKRTEEQGDPKWMESYTFSNGAIQSYGYIVYRKKLDNACSGSQIIDLTFTGRVRDRGNVLVNGKSRARIDWSVKDGTVKLEKESGKGLDSTALDIVVENQGRVNYTTSDYQDRLNTQRKGIKGPVALNGAPLPGWEVLALDFEDGFVERALESDNWVTCPSADPQTCGQEGSGDSDASNRPASSPALYRGTVRVTGDPADYFVRLEGWHKGVVFVNGFNLGRYWEKGPTRTLYLPGPVLRKGENQVVVFEEESAGGHIVLDIEPRLT